LTLIAFSAFDLLHLRERSVACAAVSNSNRFSVSFFSTHLLQRGSGAVEYQNWTRANMHQNVTLSHWTMKQNCTYQLQRKRHTCSSLRILRKTPASARITNVFAAAEFDRRYRLCEHAEAWPLTRRACP
jgi:hypothetical protein